MHNHSGDRALAALSSHQHGVVSRDQLVQLGLVAEFDGSAAHQTRRAFHQDRRRGRALAAQGIPVVRVTWRDLEEGDDGLALEVQAILATRAGWVRRFTPRTLG